MVSRRRENSKVTDAVAENPSASLKSGDSQGRQSAAVVDLRNNLVNVFSKSPVHSQTKL